MPTLVRMYFSPTRTAEARANRDHLADDIRRNFTDPGYGDKHIHFIGVWDTVESVGGLFGFRARISSRPTIRDKRIDHVRHALALDETRWTFLPRLYEDANFADGANGQSLTQKWFPGVHVDIGGGYGLASVARELRENETGGGLSHAPMRWIVAEAEALGLSLRQGWADAFANVPQALLHDEVFTHPIWALAGLRRREWPPGRVQQAALVDQTVAEREHSGGATYRPLSESDSHSSLGSP